MRADRIVPVLALLLLATPVLRSASAAPVSRAPRPARATNLDLQRRADVNDLNMFLSNIGAYAYDLITGTGGLIYPKGTTKTAVFAAGLWFGAQVNGQTRAVVGEYSQEYGPGLILPDGSWDSPASPSYLVYKVARWSGYPQDTAHVTRSDAELQADPRADPLVHHSWSEYMSGAVPHGAPWRSYRLPAPGNPADSLDVPGPDVRGDQMLWSVYNDADPSLHTNMAGGSPPLDLQVRQTTYAYWGTGALGHTIFLEFQVIHPKVLAPPPGTAFGDTLKNMYVALWMDPDLGGATDDLVGCDSARALGFCYNATNNDLIYGSSPPAVGSLLLKGPLPRGAAAPLGLTTFQKFVNGTDPSSTTSTYYAMRGLNPDGSEIIDPGTGLPTRFVDSGDPVAGTGWLDQIPADKRMMLASGPFTMAPGDTQVIVGAVVMGEGTDRLSSVSALRLYADQVRELFGSETPPDTIPQLPPDVCPRVASFWAEQCPAGADGGLSGAQLDAVAARVDEMSRFFNWPGGASAGFCSVVNPAGTPDLRQQAKQEFAALLANTAAGQLGVSEADGSPIFFNPNLAFSCPGVPGGSVAGLLALPDSLGPRLLWADYLNDNPAHPTALFGVNAGLEDFGGGAGTAFNFFGGLDPATQADSFATVEIRFSHSATQKCYRYLRLEVGGDGGAPPMGRGYLYGGLRPCNFQVWDTTHNVQLDAAFVERAFTDASGTLLPASLQPATFDSTWAPDYYSGIGAREYLFVARRPYSETPKPIFAQDGAVVDGSLPWLYALWAGLNLPDAVMDDGDRFVYDWGTAPDTTFESLLTQLESQSLEDPAVASRYGQIATCLSALNAGQVAGTTCHVPTPVLISLATADVAMDRITLAWFGGEPALAATLERNAGDGWSAVAVLAGDGGGYFHYEDRAVEAGHRYGYRLRVGGLAAPMGETWLEVPATLLLSVEGLRPNPATRGASVSFTLPRRAPARLELLDIAGRRVLAREVGELGPGHHLLRLDEGRRLASGLYFIRLTQRGSSVTTRGVIVR